MIDGDCDLPRAVGLDISGWQALTTVKTQHDQKHTRTDKEDGHENDTNQD